MLKRSRHFYSACVSRCTRCCGKGDASPRSLSRGEGLLDSAERGDAKRHESVLDLPAEREEWARLCPDGGALLKLQVCGACTSSSQEQSSMTLGRVFVGEAGCLLENTSLGSDLHNQLLRWERISQFGSADGQQVVELVLDDGREVKLQLGSQTTVSWLEDVWLKQCRERTSTAASTSSGLPRSDSSDSFESFDEEGERTPGQGPRASTGRASRPQAWPEPLAAFRATCNELPPCVEPSSTQPMYQAEFPDASMDDVRRLFEADDWIVNSLLREVIGVRDLALAPWTPGASGTQLRATRYSFPLPTKVPAAALAVVSVPDCVQVTSCSRLRATSEEVFVVMQSYSEGVPLSDYMRVDDTLVLRASTTGRGVTFKKYLHITWIKSLPFLLRPGRPMIESQGKTDGLIAGRGLQKVLGEALSKRRQ